MWFRQVAVACLFFVGGCALLPEPPARPRSFAPEETFVDGASAVYFHPQESERPIIPVRLNGAVEVAMMLDTGAGCCVISPEAAQRAGARIRHSDMTTTDGGGKTKQVDGIATIDNIGIGAAILESTAVVVNSVDMFKDPAPPVPIDGVIGISAFKNALLQIDYPSHRIVISVGALPTPDGRTVFTMYADRSGQPVVMVNVGKVRIPVTVDTGFSGGLIVPLDMANQLDRQSPAVRGPDIRSWHGESSQVMFRSRGNLTIGDHVIEQPIISATMGRDRAVMGYDFLRHFIVRIDQQNRRIGFERVDSSPIQVPPIYNSGYTVDHRTQAIRWIGPGSPAEKAGLMVGDIVKQATVTQPSEGLVSASDAFDLSVTVPATQPASARPDVRSGVKRRQLHLIVEREGQQRDIFMQVVLIIP